MTIVVSGSLRARAKEVKAAAVSPSPWRRRRMFGDGMVAEGVEGGRVIVTVRLEGKSDWVGVLVGMMDGWRVGWRVRGEGSVHSCVDG